MRTFGLQHCRTTLFATIITGLSVATPLAAQRPDAPAPAAPTAHFIPARCTDALCGADFHLAIVAALYPYDDGVVRGPSVLTLVIENRGTAPAPIATLAVTPVAHFANASFAVPRNAQVDALQPGERAVVQIPLVLDANGGAPCLAFTVSPSIVPTTQRQVYAAAGAPAVEPPLSPPPFVSFVGDVF